MDIPATQHIKGYDLHERIGAGGFGAVYRAYQSTVGREVAIKVILPGLASQPDFIRRFEAEAQLIARLEHPHITPLYDYWRDAEGAYLVMRWLRGGSLRDALEQGTYDLQAAARLMDQIAGALSLAHRNNVIHRDIKPGNILLDEDGNAYLTDFGIAKDLSLSGGGTQSDMIVGSMDYISPEQARSEPVTARTDIYSLGVTLFEMITGHHPFENVSSVERLYKHINDPLPAMTELDPALAAALNPIIQKATAKNPQQRYTDALTFAAEFRAAAGVSQTPSMIEFLTQREQDILALLVEGLSNKEIAQRLTVTLNTVKWYLNQIYNKLGVRSRVQAMVRARELNLLSRSITSPAVLPLPTEDFYPENPYKGLRAFRAADYQDFFGREKITHKLLKVMGEGGEYSRFLAVVGPSGSGKSSLVKAGLIPALWGGKLPGSEKWFIAEMLPGARPVDELEIVLAKIAAAQSANLHEQLQRDQYGLSRVASLILPDDDSELLLVIDQFEEVFTLVEDETMRTHFLGLLYAAVTAPHSRVRVVITLRADFYDRPLHYPDFGNLLRNRLETIMPLSAEELERAIAKPAERVGLTFEPGLLSSIVADGSYQPGALPLLQYALTELFEQRQGRLLTCAAYLAIGGTVGALAKRADELYLALDEPARQAAQQLFLRLVTLGAGTEDTRRRVTRSELLALVDNVDLLEEILDTYTAYRLLSVDHDPVTHTPTVEVAHEALLREWERLREWLNESRDALRIQRQLTQLAGEWRVAQQDKSFLLRGSRLEMFEQWIRETTLAVTAPERDFLQASLNQRTIEQQAEIAQQGREIHLEKRSRSFLRGLVGVFAIATIIAVGLSAVAWRERNRAEEARTTSEQNAAIAEENAAYSSSIALAAAARSALAYDNPDQAIALAVAANTSLAQPPAYSQSILYETATFIPAPGSTLNVPLNFVGGISAISPDGQQVMTLQYEDKSIIYWDLITGDILAQWQADFLAENHFCLQNNTLFTSSGISGYAPIASADFSTGAIIEFEVATGREIRRLIPAEGLPCGMIISPDRQTLLTPTFQQQGDGSFIPAFLYTWEIATGRLISQAALDVSDLQAEVTAGGFLITSTSDGKRLLFTSNTGLIVLWDTVTGEQIRTLKLPESDAAAAFSTPQGIVSIASNTEQATTTLTLWDENTGEMLREEILKNTPNAGSMLSPDQHTLAISQASTITTLLFDTQTWQITHELNGYGEAFTPDGQHLLMSSTLGQRLWTLANEAELMRMEGVTTWVSGLRLSPDGRSLLAQQMNGSLALWELATGQMIHSWGETYDTFNSIAFSPDSRLVASTSRPSEGLVSEGLCPDLNSYITVTDAATGEIIWQVAQPHSYVKGVVFTQDRLMTIDWRCENTITVWDAATGEKLSQWAGHQAPIFSIAASPDGKWIATGSADMSVLLWNTSTGRIIHTLQHDGRVRGVAFSADSALLLSYAESGNLYIWETASGQQIQQLTGHSSIGSAQFSPDGQYVVSRGLESSVIVWRWQIGEAVRQIELPPLMGPGNSAVLFSPDGKSIFLADEPGIIRQLDLMLEPDALLNWVYAHRYLRDLSCEERDLYRVEPLCP